MFALTAATALAAGGAATIRIPTNLGPATRNRTSAIGRTEA
jgi:hypothetical protein